MFKPVNSNLELPKLEEKLIEDWKKNKTFEKSIENRPEDKTWTFLDGPPFVTGMPHYGTLSSSIPKDIFGRYWTMKGYRVRRVWGWDGHGLPIENKVENKLGITRKKDIEEKVGVKKFIDECLTYVKEVSGEWEWYVDHIGRWVDFEHAYRTWDTDYMESVMWVFKQMYEKGHIYKGLRVSLYCPHCSTPISNFEVAMDADNYKNVTESATTYKYKVVGADKTFFLAWSTTPWNKIVTPALAVNPKLLYVKVKQGDEFYILAKTTLKILKEEPKYEIIEEMQGESLLGMQFEPHYDYYKNAIKEGEKAFVIVGGDFVTADEGTGIVTIAAYGEEDLKVMKDDNIHIELHIDDEGMVRESVPQFGGMYYLKANKAVNEDLQSRDLLYRDDQYTHSVAHCWRCHTRLIYAPQNAWFVNIADMKPELKKTNEAVNWFPSHFKHGRFQKSIEAAPDWCISRSRYWGSPVPVWECSELDGGCGERIVPGSIKELEELSGQKVVSLHKPEIDEITILCPKCGKKVHRVVEVLDSWIEAGSASFAERHYPFVDAPLESFFPPDFIVEYTGQIRAWFYVVHVIANAIYERAGFKNVGVTGVILGTDGKKMSKNLGNYPDPREMINKYGGDALRMYLMGSPLMRGEDILISEDEYRNQVRGTLLILWNVYNFFVTYANIDGWEANESNIIESENLLDHWIVSRLNQTVKHITTAMESYDTVSAINEMKTFVDELSTWYIRRSRDRVGLSADDQKDKGAFYATTYHVLTTICKVLAPIIPFITEEMYKNLSHEDSVHLADWPSADESRIQTDLELQMVQVRKIVELGLAARKENQIKVRQPLQKLSVFVTTDTTKFKDDLEFLIKDELNVKEVSFEKGDKDLSVKLDLTITPELKVEGEARELIREIQKKRKEIGVAMDAKVVTTLPSWPKEFEDLIKKETLTQEINKGTDLTVTPL